MSADRIGEKVEYWTQGHIEWGIIHYFDGVYYYINFAGNPDIKHKVLPEHVIE